MDIKFIITGMHDSGKEECAQILQNYYNISYGKILINTVPKSNLYEYCDITNLNNLYNSNTYIFFKEAFENNIYKSMSQETWDNNNVFFLAPDEVVAIFSNKLIKYNIIWIWLDTTYIYRKNIYNEKNRINIYSFSEKEQNELIDNELYINKLYDKKNILLYFNNEEPGRVATIIATLIKYPELITAYYKYFNN